MLDEIDRGLIHALRVDGRAPFSRIGAVLGVSTQTIARRYRRLTAEAGLRVVGLPDPQRAGQTQWLARLTATPHAAQDLAQALARRSDTSWVRLASGGTEIVAVIHTTAADGNSLLLHDIPRTAGITAVSAHCILHTYLGGPTTWQAQTAALTKDQENALRAASGQGTGAGATSATTDRAGDGGGPAGAADRDSERGNSSGQGRTAVDRGRVPGIRAGDGELLAGLGRDGRMSLADLAKVTGWSVGTVGRRLAELQGSGAIFFDVDVDPPVLGAMTAAMLWMSVTPAHLDEVARSLAEHEELAFVGATTGPTNLAVQALCKDPAALHEYLTHRLAAYESIHALESAPVLRTVKSAAPFVSRAASRRTGVS
ncbi:AsnC family transcriptional regulator [Kribbella sp. NPDC006257]|uniref:Lrp/AsnC family transcriptional regulator n=1 Tax=Kribbella sp. NPDC006257 TaxID=3156738 RepID=UPI0033AD4647